MTNCKHILRRRHSEWSTPLLAQARVYSVTSSLHWRIDCERPCQAQYAVMCTGKLPTALHKYVMNAPSFSADIALDYMSSQGHAMTKLHNLS